MSRPLAFIVVTLGLGPLAAAVADARANPTASPGPDVAALREIGRVRARTPFCRAALDGAAAATNVALQNDAMLDDTARYLGKVELDENKLAKPNAIAELQKRYAAISTSAQGAIVAAKQLHALAATAPTPAQGDALGAYANAIGGALRRQAEVAASFRRFAMYLESHEQVSWQAHNEALFYAARTPPGQFDGGANPHDRVAPLLTEVARNESTALGERREPEIADEIRASAAIAPAFDPCRSTDDLASPAP